MKIRQLILIPLLFTVLSCTKQDGLIVKDYKANEVNLLKSSKEKIIIITNYRICHNCIINLDEFLEKHFNLGKCDYYVLTEDLLDTPSRRVTFENYKNIYTPKVDRVLFTSENLIIQKKLHIPKKIFTQATPYLIYIGKNKKPVYYSSQVIFDSMGNVKESFKIY